jgi:hypothetical protein
MMDMAQAAQKEHSQRPWWKSKVLWGIVLASVLALIIVAAIEQAGGPAATPYGAFLDQLEAGNVASISFRGTEIDGVFKQPLKGAASNGAAPKNEFRTRMPDFGDPALIPELRRQHVAIDVASSTSWIRLLAGVPLPMLFFVGVILVAGLMRLLRGGESQAGSALSMHPMQGMIALVSGLFAKGQANTAQDSDKTERR